MKKHHTPQGSASWHALRNAPMTGTASEAPAMMSCSPYLSRTELLDQKKTGIKPEATDAQQYVFDKGHNTEAAYRPLAELTIGEDLYPVTGTIEIDGITYLASFDGLTMTYRKGFEHKLWSIDIARHIQLHGEPPIHHVWQLEQQILVSGADSILFVTSDGTENKCEQCTYTSQPERRAQLIAGWKRFFADLETHEVATKTVKVEAEPVDALPAVSVRMDGQIIVSSNLDVFGQRLRTFVAELNPKPETDQDFANADAAVKTLDKAEKALESAKASAIAQVASVEEMTTAVDALIALSKSTRLALDKLVKARKEAIKFEVVTRSQADLAEHITGLNQRIGRPLMPRIAADFGEAIKGKKSVDTLKSAAADELARAKTEADMVHTRIVANLAGIDGTGLPMLFADVAALVTRDPADLAVLIDARVTNHRAAEAKRMDAERERIREEEIARLAIEAKAAEQTTQAMQRAAAPPPAAQAPSKPMSDREWAALPAGDRELPHHLVYGSTSTPTQPAPAKQQDFTHDTGARLTLTQVNERLAPVSISVAGLSELGFEPAAQVKASRLYRESDLPAIARAIARHVIAASNRALQAA